MTSPDCVVSFPDMTDDRKPPLWDHTRSVAAARILVEVGEEHGVTTSSALAGTGLDRAGLLDPGLEIEAGQELAIARNLLRQLGDQPGLGTEAESKYTLASLGLWGFTLISSPTVRELVRLGTRYSALSFAFIRPVLVEDLHGCRVIYDDTEIPHDVRDFFVERELAKLLMLSTPAFGARPGFQVETTFEGPRSAILERVCPGRTVIHGATQHALVFTRDLLNQPLPQADPVIARAMEAQCAELLQRRQRRRGFSAHVRARILANLQNPPGIDEIAQHMHIEERTLRRKLIAEGTSYRELADEVRSTMATELLGEGRLTVQEVAVRLGYHDAAAFSRAFKRWTGQRPGAYRVTSI